MRMSGVRFSCILPRYECSGNDAAVSEMIWTHRYAAGIDSVVASVIDSGPVSGCVVDINQFPVLGRNPPKV